MNEPVYHLTGVLHGRDAPDDFSGPLDLILQLLRNRKISIQDIRIADILEQYLAWMAEMQRLDLEIASEFIAMASYLLYIKSRMLVSASDPETVDEMESLIRSLEERERKTANARIQLAAQWLGEHDEGGRLMYPKPAQSPASPTKPYDVRHDPVDLLRAFDAILERSARRIPPSVSAFVGIAQAEPYPVEMKAAQLLQTLVQVGTASMSGLLENCGSRSELVATFLALLELGRQGSVSFLDQDGEDVEVTFLKMPAADA